ncbi:hypothetical protein CISG_00404 [Coccidioides immitis RMSCC 3703]|uniref:Uncharacterized protein n=1 Tax=Coccidioides immitis RMSCC 3703 TaxID=454286 RepID=A0A0J8QI37_COCIT|nr:hypothetical protein CISG_00404 [Coccidioides immitis RMSCC 3703]
MQLSHIFAEKLIIHIPTKLKLELVNATFESITISSLCRDTESSFAQVEENHRSMRLNVGSRRDTPILVSFLPTEDDQLDVCCASTEYFRGPVRGKRGHRNSRWGIRSSLSSPTSGGKPLHAEHPDSKDV